MTDREKLVELLLSCDEVHERDLNDDWEDGELEAIADHLLANGVEKVVYCDECVNHGNCFPEEAFRLGRMQKSFCAAGKAKEGAGRCRK